MPSLAELQGAVARALVTGTPLPEAGLLGDLRPARRLAIHQRHFVASLTAALMQKFPACAWLTSAELVGAAARAFVRVRPPQKPCIAEYGREFPEFLAGRAAAGAWPHVRAFGDLEWAAGQVSIAVAAPPLDWPVLAGLGAERLLDAHLTLQPGLFYRDASWRVDELLLAYLRGAAPFAPRAAATFVEIRGARGELSLARLDGATYAFRAALVAGGSIGDAASLALERDTAFDAGAALRALCAAGLAIDVRASREE